MSDFSISLQISNPAQQHTNHAPDHWRNKHNDLRKKYETLVVQNQRLAIKAHQSEQLYDEITADNFKLQHEAKSNQETISELRKVNAEQSDKLKKSIGDDDLGDMNISDLFQLKRQLSSKMKQVDSRIEYITRQLVDPRFSDLKQKERDDYYLKFCPVCQKSGSELLEEKSHLFCMNPCGHPAMCSNCISQYPNVVNKCPICNTRIMSTTEIYL